MQSRICNVINAGTLFGLGTVFLSFYGTGRIEQYLNPSFRPLVMVGGILMLIMGVGLFRSFHEMYGLDYLALRPFNVYGPRMDAVGAYTEVMIRWMDRLANGQPCVILGDGEQTMDFVFVEDVARAYILAAKTPLTDDDLFADSSIGTVLLRRRLRPPPCESLVREPGFVWLDLRFSAGRQHVLQGRF